MESTVPPKNGGRTFSPAVRMVALALCTVLAVLALFSFVFLLVHWNHMRGGGNMRQNCPVCAFIDRTGERLKVLCAFFAASAVPGAFFLFVCLYTPVIRRSVFTTLVLLGVRLNT